MKNVLVIIIVGVILTAFAGCQRTSTTSVRNPHTEALLKAARQGHADAIRTLLSDSSVDVNARDERGSTALIEAARFGHDDTVQVLLSAKADIEAKDDEGKTALMYAVQGGHDHVVKLLKQAGAK